MKNHCRTSINSPLSRVYFKLGTDLSGFQKPDRSYVRPLLGAGTRPVGTLDFRDTPLRMGMGGLAIIFPKLKRPYGTKTRARLLSLLTRVFRLLSPPYSVTRSLRKSYIITLLPVSDAG